jgi:thioredoxin 1
MSQSIPLNDETFNDKALASNKPILVDFWAEWCGPCKMIAPLLEDLANDMSDKLTVAKVNVDESMGITEKYNVRGIPTLLLFKDGKLLDRKVGAMSKEQLQDWLNKEI